MVAQMVERVNEPLSIFSEYDTKAAKMSPFFFSQGQVTFINMCDIILAKTIKGIKSIKSL